MTHVLFVMKYFLVSIERTFMNVIYTLSAVIGKVQILIIWKPEWQTIVTTQ